MKRSYTIIVRSLVLATVGLLLFVCCSALGSPVPFLEKSDENLSNRFEFAIDELPDEAPYYFSLTTGKLYFKEQPSYAPIGVVIENSWGARPQWGLQNADVVYEFHKDYGQVTRFLAIFNDTIPDRAGPVRSARVYTMRLQQEWDCIFCHFGGPEYSGVAKTSIALKENSGHIRLQLNFLHGFGKNTLWYRSWSSEELTAPRAPTNVIMNVKAVAEAYPDYTARPRPFLWREQSPYTDADGKIIKSVYVQFYSGQACTYKYNAETGLLERYSGADTPFLTRDTGGILTVQNLIVQHVEYTRQLPQDSVHYIIGLTGSGKADFFIGGRHIKGTWSRPTNADKTTYYDSSGNEIALLPGNTWIEIHPNARTITVEY